MALNLPQGQGFALGTAHAFSEFTNGENGLELAITISQNSDIALLNVDTIDLYCVTGGTATITTASGFDTYLIIYDENSTQLAFNDDINGASNRNSQITFQFTSATRYYVLIRGYSRTEYGACTVTISGNAVFGQPSAPVIVVPPVPNIKIGYGNLIDDSAIVASGVSSTLPVGNLKSLLRGRIFRGASGTQVIDVTFKTPSPVGMIALWFPTQSWGGVNHFSVTFYNGSTAVKTITTAIFSAFFTEITATRAVITITSPSTFDLSRIFIGRFFEPKYNLDFGFAMKHRDLSTSERTEDGSLHIVKKAKYRTFTFNLSEITNDERARISELVRLSGTQNDVFISVFNGDVESFESRRWDFEMLGVFEDGAELVLTNANRWGQKLVVNEL